MYQSYVSQLVMELELRGYSPRTVSSYSRYLQRLLSHTKKSVSEINEDDLRHYLHSLVCSKVSTSYVNSVYSNKISQITRSVFG
jgi:site-specific recombinase XerD